MNKAYLTTLLVALMLLPALAAPPAYAGFPFDAAIQDGASQTPSDDAADVPPLELVVTGDPDDAITGNRGKPVLNDSTDTAPSLGNVEPGDLMRWLEVLALTIARESCR